MAYRKILTLVSMALSILVSDYAMGQLEPINNRPNPCLLYTSPSPRDATLSRMPSSA